MAEHSLGLPGNSDPLHAVCIDLSLVVRELQIVKVASILRSLETPHNGFLESSIVVNLRFFTQTLTNLLRNVLRTVPLQVAFLAARWARFLWVITHAAVVFGVVLLAVWTIGAFSVGVSTTLAVAADDKLLGVRTVDSQMPYFLARETLFLGAIPCQVVICSAVATFSLGLRTILGEVIVGLAFVAFSAVFFRAIPGEMLLALANTACLALFWHFAVPGLVTVFILVALDAVLKTIECSVAELPAVAACTI